MNGVKFEIEKTNFLTNETTRKVLNIKAEDLKLIGSDGLWYVYKNDTVKYKFNFNRFSYVAKTDNHLVMWDRFIDSSPKCFMEILEDMIREEL